MGIGDNIILCMMLISTKGTTTIANEIGCPDLNENPTFAEETRVWICEQKNWWKNAMEWKLIVEKECLINATDWQWLFPCPDFSGVQCQNEISLHNETDQFGCSFVSCTDGLYQDKQIFRNVWRKLTRTYKKFINYYADNLIYCPKRGCPEPAVNDPSTAASLTTPMNVQLSEEPTKMTTMYVTSGPGDTEKTNEPDVKNCIVIHRRIDNSVNFNRNWDEYVAGFGNTSGNIWLGLEEIYQLTMNGNKALRIDMITSDGMYMYAQYSSFKISSSADNYTLNVSGYSGNATDAFDTPSRDADFNGRHNGQQFTTADIDNDLSNTGNCAVSWKGGWWFNECFSVYLNGEIGAYGLSWQNQDTLEHVFLNYAEMTIC